jgi:hypothetical protein
MKGRVRPRRLIASVKLTARLRLVAFRTLAGILLEKVIRAPESPRQGRGSGKSTPLP